MRPMPTIARFQCGVFSAQQAARDAWTRDALRHGVASGRLLRVRVGAYQVADLQSLDVLDPYEQARWRHAAPAIGAALTTPGAAASHSTAAVLLGTPLLFVPDTPCVTVPPWFTGEVPGIHLHRCARASRLLVRGAVGCTDVEDTAIDLAREHGVVAGAVAFDFALHEKLTTKSAIETHLLGCARWPGIRRARLAAAVADGRSESVLETRSRLKLAEFGLPEPDLQVSIGNDWGGFVARVDFYWDQFGVVGEADGDVKYAGTEPGPLLAEKRRQSVLDDLDLEVVRWGNRDLHDFARTAARLQRAFARGRSRPPQERRWTVLP